VVFFSRNFAGHREWHDIFKVLKGKKPATKNTLSSKAINQNRRKDSFPDKQKLKEFMATKPALQEMLKGTLSRNHKK